MNKQRRFWFGLIGGGSLLAAGLGYLIYTEYENIDLARAEVASLNASIASARQLLTGTPQLEREVIVLRETEEAIKELLPDEQGVNDFVRKLQDFEQESEVSITSLKKKPPEALGRKKSKDDFDKVAYQLTFEADAFQMLEFLDSIESHSRFMGVPAFKLQASPRRDVVETGQAAHRVQLDVETYVYEPQSAFEPVKIEGYARKRELLLGEISRRRQGLSMQEYTYRGKRSRRDPWVDPRMPANVEDETSLTVQEQNAIVDELVAVAQAVSKLWDDVQDADNVVKEMQLRAELESRMAELETELRRIRDEGAIRYPPTERRLTLEVEDRLVLVRDQIANLQKGNGPSLEALTQLAEAMASHLAAGEHELALNAFATVEGRLDIAAGDPARKPWVERLRLLEADARILSEFSRLEIDIKGVAIMEGVPPVALVNGKALGEGDSVNDNLIIRGIRPGEIEFIYKGVILVRRF